MKAHHNDKTLSEDRILFLNLSEVTSRNFQNTLYTSIRRNASSCCYVIDWLDNKRLNRWISWAFPEKRFLPPPPIYFHLEIHLFLKCLNFFHFWHNFMSTFFFVLLFLDFSFPRPCVQSKGEDSRRLQICQNEITGLICSLPDAERPNSIESMVKTIHWLLHPNPIRNGLEGREESVSYIFQRKNNALKMLLFLFFLGFLTSWTSTFVSSCHCFVYLFFLLINNLCLSLLSKSIWQTIVFLFRIWMKSFKAHIYIFFYYNVVFGGRKWYFCKGKMVPRSLVTKPLLQLNNKGNK